MNKPYYQTHEPPHCPTCDCGAAADALEAARRDTQRLEALANGARVIQSWSRPDRLAIKLPDTLTADKDGLMLDVLRNAIDNATGAPND